MGVHIQKAVDGVLWGAAILIAGAAVYLMLAPVPAGAQTIHPRLAHLLLYLIQTFVTLLAAVWRPGRRAGAATGSALLVAVGVVVFATALELGQSFVPERQTEAADLVVNVLGVGAGLAAWRVVRRAG